MLIDDDEDDNFFHQLVAQESGISESIKVAESAQDALDIIRNLEDLPELIFLDINMPKMNGWEFIEEYARLKLNNNMRAVIIMLTTSMNPVDLEKSKKSPYIAAFKTKPLNAKMLTEIYDSFFQLA
jgi:CheY-like chemotaxis protein